MNPSKSAHETRAWCAGMLFLATVLAGCAAPALESGDLTNGAAGTSGPRAAVPRQDVTFTVSSIHGGQLRMQGIAWIPPNATAALLAIHGGNGGKGEWASFAIEGYSLGEAVSAAGLAFFAVDYPGQGTSQSKLPGGTANAPTTFEDTARAFAQVGDAIRAGDYSLESGTAQRYATVNALGHSFGGHVLVAAQGLVRPFDAVVLASFTQAGLSPAFGACYRGEAECDDAFWWNLDNANPAIIEEIRSRYNTTAATTLVGGGLWAGCFDCAHALLEPVGERTLLMAMAERVEAPVLLISGEGERAYDIRGWATEESYYANSRDVAKVLVPGAGHILFHHMNHQEVYGTITDWLEAQGSP